jgi:hypothetical protein
VIQASGHPLERAGLPEQRGAPAIVRHPAQPVPARSEPLGDEHGTVAEDHPFQRGARVAAMRQQGTSGARSEALEHRVGQHAGRCDIGLWARA